MFKISTNQLKNLLANHKTQNAKFEKEVIAINNTVLLECINSFVGDNNKPDFANLAFSDRYEYQQIIVDSGKSIKGIESINIKTKALKVSDALCLKANSKSIKTPLSDDLKTLLDCLGGNCARNYMANRNNIELVKIYTQFDKSLNCFVSDSETGRDATSLTQIEKQINRIFVLLFGENVVMARRTLSKQDKENGKTVSDVEFFIDSLTTAKLVRDKSEYVTKGELQTLDSLLILAYEIKHNRQYRHTLKCASGKAPKKQN